MTRLEKLRKLAAETPDDPFIHYGVGLECMQLERFTEALAAFSQSLALDSQYIAAHYQKSQAQLKLGQRDAARVTLTAGIAAARAAGQKHAADEMTKMLEALG